MWASFFPIYAVIVLSDLALGTLLFLDMPSYYAYFFLWYCPLLIIPLLLCQFLPPCFLLFVNCGTSLCLSGIPLIPPRACPHGQMWSFDFVLHLFLPVVCMFQTSGITGCFIRGWGYWVHLGPQNALLVRPHICEHTGLMAAAPWSLHSFLLNSLVILSPKWIGLFLFCMMCTLVSVAPRKSPWFLKYDWPLPPYQCLTRFVSGLIKCLLAQTHRPCIHIFSYPGGAIFALYSGY